MDQRELEVTVLSAQDLKNVKLSGGKMSPYAVAYIYPNMKLSTSVAKDGGVNPTWNSMLHLACEESLFQQGNANITVDLLHHGTFSNKPIGTVLIPLTSLKDSSAESKVKAYEIKRPSGKPKGVLNVAVKVGKVATVAPEPPVPAKATQANPNERSPIPEKNKDYIPAGYPVQASGSQYNPQYQSQYESQYAYQYGGQYPRYQPEYVPPPGYQAPYSQQAYYQQQYPRRSRFGGLGGGGLGTGLVGGALGGVLLGSALGGGFGDGGGFGGDGGGFGGDGGDFGGGDFGGGD